MTTWQARVMFCRPRARQDSSRRCLPTRFLKKTSVIEYTRDALESYAQDIIALAQSEHLDAHANSIAVRFAEENNDENR